MTMTTNVTLAVGYALTAGSVASLLLMWLADWRERCYSRREITRFPMFAARDDLVSLVATGVMSEDDHPWTWSYRSVCTILRTHQKWHLWGVVLGYTRYVAKIHSNPAEKKRLEEMQFQMKAARQAHPEFDAAQIRIGDAFRGMVQARTNVCHKTLVWLLILGAALLSSLLYLSITVVPAVLRSFRDPTSAELVGFSANPV